MTAVLTTAVVVALRAPGAGASEGAAATTRSASKLLAEADREFRADHFDAAVRLYGEALNAAGADSAKVLYARHKALIKLRKLPAAIADLTAAIKADATHQMAYLQRANLYLLTGRCGDAAADYYTVLRMDPAKRDAQARLPHAQACQAALERADYAQRMGDLAGVRDALSAAMENDRATAASNLLMQRAEASFALGDWEQTMADTARVLKMDGATVDAYLLRARALARYGDYATARAHYQECLVYDPEHRGCKDGYRLVKAMAKVKERGDAALAAGRWDDAVTSWSEGLSLEGASELPSWRREALPKLAKAHLRRGDPHSAARFASEAISMDDGCAEAHWLLGEASLSLEQWEEAARQGHRAHELDRGNHEYASFAQRADAALKQSKSKDYYKILGVRRDADDRAIKKAYRMLAMEWHPDKHTGEAKVAAEVRFRDIAEAHEVLTDADKRGRYDRGEDVSGNPQQGHPGGPFGFHGGPFGFPGGGPGGGGFTFTFRAG